MLVSMIAAMAKDRVIGADNDMPWHLPADLAHFKKVTMGKPIIMGRKTYQSIGRALPGRLNIVVTRDTEFKLEDAAVVKSCEQAIDLAKEQNTEEVMIIGGGTVYQHFLPYCNRLYLTEIELEVSGDTYFPDYRKVSDWHELEREHHSKNDKNPYEYSFIMLER